MFRTPVSTQRPVSTPSVLPPPLQAVPAAVSVTEAQEEPKPIMFDPDDASAVGSTTTTQEPQVIPATVGLPAPITHRPMTRDEARAILGCQRLFPLLKLIAFSTNRPRVQTLLQGRARQLVELAESAEPEGLMVPVEGPIYGETKPVPRIDCRRVEQWGENDIESKTWGGMLAAVQRIKDRVQGSLKTITRVDDIIRGGNQEVMTLFAELVGRLISVTGTYTPTFRHLDKLPDRAYYDLAALLASFDNYTRDASGRIRPVSSDQHGGASALQKARWNLG